MAVAQLNPVYDELLDYIISKATPQEILAFKPSDAAQERANELTEKNKQGTLSPEEKAELGQLIELDTLVSALKAKALISLQGDS